MKISSKSQKGFTTIELVIVMVFITVLGYLLLMTHSAVSEKNRDNDRKTDITTIEGQLEVYQAEQGKYPTVSNMNNPKFRLTNMKDLSVGDLQDPKWKSLNSYCTSAGKAILQNSSTPAHGCYGYTPIPAGCDNDSSDCTGYILSANLESGGHYVKESVNR